MILPDLFLASGEGDDRPAVCACRHPTNTRCHFCGKYLCDGCMGGASDTGTPLCAVCNREFNGDRLYYGNEPLDTKREAPNLQPTKLESWHEANAELRAKYPDEP